MPSGLPSPPVSSRCSRGRCRAGSLSAQAGRNPIGYCVGLKGLEAAKAAGFDYVELGTTELTALSDADFEAAVAQAKAVGIPTPNANLFLPATLKLTGPEAATPEQQMAYVTKAFTRLERLGVTILCFGSGGARRVPDGFPKDEAFAQLVAFGKRIAPEAKAHGITVVIEPLRRQETNIINTAAEGFALVKAVGPSELRAAGRLLPPGQRAGRPEDHGRGRGTTSGTCTWPTRRAGCSR